MQTNKVFKEIIWWDDFTLADYITLIFIGGPLHIIQIFINKIH